MELNRAIDQVVEEGQYATPADIASELMSRDLIDLQTVLHRLLRNHVARYLTSRRETPTVDEAPKLKVPTQARVTAQEVVAASMTGLRPAITAVVRTPDPKTAQSAKIQSYRQAASSWLEESIAIHGAHGWKRIGDCTREDMRALVASREALAINARFKAELYRGWLEKMEEHEVEVLRDLPTQLLGNMGAASIES